MCDSKCPNSALNSTIRVPDIISDKSQAAFHESNKTKNN